MLGIPLALVVSNATEWWFHKHVLHGKGKRRESFWSFHWHDHHRNVRRLGHYDPTYEEPAFGTHAGGKETWSLVALAAAHLPLLPVAPFYTLTVLGRIVHYHRVHKRAHLDPEWAREHLPWHYDHHMGPNQDANWGVTNPWFDELVGTREPYAHTPREAEDQAKRARLAERRAAAASEKGALAERGAA